MTRAHASGGRRTWSDGATGVALLLATAVVWGTTGAAQELAGAAVGPAGVGAARLVVGAAALAALALTTSRGRATRRVLVGPLWRWTLAAGAATAIYQAAFFSAVDRTGVALAAVVALGSAPVFCGLLARRLLGEPLPTSWRWSTGCAVAGCALLLVPVSARGPSVSGVTPALLAGGCYGVYTVCVKRLLCHDADVIPTLVATLGVGAVLSSPVLIQGPAGLTEPRGLLLAAWLGLVATAGAYLLFARGLVRVPASTAGTLSLAEPLTAALLGIVVLAERPSPVSLAGVVVLCAGLSLAARANEPRPASAVAQPA